MISARGLNVLFRHHERFLAANTQALILQKSFHYNNWYKIEREKNRRQNKRQKDFFADHSIKDLTKFTTKEVLKQFNILYEEAKDYYQRDRKILLEHGDLEYLFKFDDIEQIKKWQTNTDSGYEIGHSEANLDLSEQKTALFRGILRNDFDKPEKMKATYTGYANMTSIPTLRSFYRKKLLDLGDYTHFRLRVRGDGRNYMFILKNDHHYVETQTYLCMSPLYTHGGPYWQDVRIPFSKFFQVTHGRISDRQFRFIDDDLTSVGITCMDGIDGPFHLEIDSISVYKDKQMSENLAYETYKIPKYISNT